MRTLLDTHTLFWWLADDDRLSASARQVLAGDPDTVHVSVATAWEIAIKVGLGKWPEARWLIDNFEREVAIEGFVLLPIEVSHVRAAGLMRVAHRDPFDRLLRRRPWVRASRSSHRTRPWPPWAPHACGEGGSQPSQLPRRSRTSWDRPREP